jgi:hypothetical protein
MNHPAQPDRNEPGTSEEFGGSPPPSGSGSGRGSQPARTDRGRSTPDKEGGAPADELDLDGDGARHE